MERQKKSILKNVFNNISGIFGSLSILFGTSNLGKSVEQMNQESIDKAWFQVGSDLGQAYIKIAKQHGYKNEQ